MELTEHEPDVVKELVSHLEKGARQLEKTYGPLSFFALFEQAGSPGLWDVVVSAPWLNPGRQGIAQIVQAIRPCLKATEIQTIARILPLSADRQLLSSPPIPAVTHNGTPVVIGPALLGDVEVQRGYILISDETVALQIVQNATKSDAAELLNVHLVSA